MKKIKNKTKIKKAQQPKRSIKASKTKTSQSLAKKKTQNTPTALATTKILKNENEIHDRDTDDQILRKLRRRFQSVRIQSGDLNEIVQPEIVYESTENSKSKLWSRALLLAEVIGLTAALAISFNTLI